ncbi:MAG TPA: TraR/DksA C4-type zinc finger protein [Acidimicrobiales bacterium]|nr:TraR/DksA C4-type zinc finger protein [Acidimicrobiales bacterium]
MATLGEVPDQLLLTTIREELEGEQARLRAHISQLTGADRPPLDENFADSGQVAAVNSENLALLGKLGEQLAEVDRTLVKLGTDAYGRCEACGMPIAEARLEAMPATRYCIDHA